MGGGSGEDLGYPVSHGDYFGEKISDIAFLSEDSKNQVVYAG